MPLCGGGGGSSQPSGYLLLQFEAKKLFDRENPRPRAFFERGGSGINTGNN
jgi:hypothetical protein